jgi:hypothetical protein
MMLASNVAASVPVCFVMYVIHSSQSYVLPVELVR